MSDLLDHIKKVSKEVETWPEWKKNHLGAEYVTLNHLIPKEGISEPEFDSPYGSVWIVSVDKWGSVSILQTPNIHPSFFEFQNAEEIGLPYEVEDLAPGVYRWTCDYSEQHDWESGICDGWEFEVVEQELLWSLDNLKEETQ